MSALADPTTRQATATTAPAAGAGRGGLVHPAYLRAEVRRLLRNRRTLFFSVGMPVIFFLVFGVTQSAPADKAYVAISLAVYGAMMAASTTGAAVAVERAQGWSRQLRLTPLRPSAYVGTKAVAAVVVALLPVLVEFALAAASGARMDGSDWLVAGLIAWIGSLVFAALGLTVGFLVPSENAMQIVGAGNALLAMLGGLFVPLSVLGRTMRTIAEYTPAYGVGTLARYPLASEGSITGAVVNVVAWTLVLAAGAALLFRRDTARV